VVFGGVKLALIAVSVIVRPRVLSLGHLCVRDVIVRDVSVEVVEDKQSAK